MAKRRWGRNWSEGEKRMVCAQTRVEPWAIECHIAGRARQSVHSAAEESELAHLAAQVRRTYGGFRMFNFQAPQVSFIFR